MFPLCFGPEEAAASRHCDHHSLSPRWLTLEPLGLLVTGSQANSAQCGRANPSWVLCLIQSFFVASV